MSIKVGIFFGGPSREREISFAGGRTVYDNLDKALFEPVPIFVDSFRRWYLLDWKYLYRGTIRDFFPPVEDAPRSAHGFQVYQESLGPQDELSLEAMGRKIGRRIRRHDLTELIDVAFLALHGEYGEDGQLQKELDYAGIPYTGSGVRASEIGMDKAVQKELMLEAGFASPPIHVIARGDFDDHRVQEHFATAESVIGWPMVIRPARQGSSIGVAILREDAGLEGFERAVNAAFFRELLPVDEYRQRPPHERLEYVRQLSDLRDGVAFPLDADRGGRILTLYTPDELYDYLEAAAAAPTGHPLITLTGHQSEEKVIVEGFIDGKEFSTIVLRQEDGSVVALPPTEIVKPASELFDYRSKYMPGRSRKVTPIDLPTDRINAIREECERLFTALGFGVYARIDGFHTPGGGIYLNDPNTTSGMLPSSFFFHQAAEIGLNPSQFLTYIIRISLRERAVEHSGADAGAGVGGEEQGEYTAALEVGRILDEALDARRATEDTRERIAVLLGGTSFERHISVESGRNVYEKLASSQQYRPRPVFLTRAEGELTGDPARDWALYQLPINLLLKDNADDIRDKLGSTEQHPVIAEIRAACTAITDRYADRDVVFHPRRLEWSALPTVADGVFIALHGRPGEDGQVQSILEPLGLYYNGSGVASSRVTIDKHATLSRLAEAGLPVTQQWLATREEFDAGEAAFYDRVEEQFGYPLIAKPVDDGCSSAVKLIKQRDELHAYCHLTFQPAGTDEANARREMKISAREEWPRGKETILFETAITAGKAEKFLEITGGMLTSYAGDRLNYEVFEPSETLAGGEVLSLEEKFLAGEGQNLTPARLATDNYSYDYVAGHVRSDLEKAARALHVEGYCRIDAFVRVHADGTVETVPIEVNSLPGMTPATAIFHQAALAGYQPAEFIAAILAFGKARRDRGVATGLPVTEPALTITAATPTITSAAAGYGDQAEPNALAGDREAAGVAGAAALGTAFLDDEPEDADLTGAVDNTYVAPPYADDPEPARTDSAGEKKGFFANFLSLFLKGYFWKNALAALLFFVLCFFVLRIGLNLYTSHGQSIPLPDFTNMPREEAAEIADDLGLTVKFEKGVYDPSRAPGIVTRQHPKAGAGVKKNRSIYLTVLSDEAPMIKLPSLVGEYDYDQYTARLERMGEIKSTIRDREFNGKLEDNTILHFYYEDRKITDEELRGGKVEVPMGSTLEFVVSVRETGQVTVPKVKCKTFGEVEFLLDGSELKVGKIVGEVSDRANAYVTRTEPTGGVSVATGSSLTVYLSASRPDDCN